jgi:hypothetical protein
MRLARLFRRHRPDPAPPAGERGFSGLATWSGQIGEEYLPELRGRQAVQVYDRMRRSDGSIAALELVLTLPIRAAAWSVEPAGVGATDREAADLVAGNLFDGMTVPWDDLLREALLGLFYGFMAFEKVFEERDGYVRWRKWAARHPRTIVRWLFDSTGGVQGVEQMGTRPDGTPAAATLPIAKLILFIWRREFGNPEGFPVLRPAYKHWYILDSLYRIANIGLERSLVGTPVIKQPLGSMQEETERALEIIRDLRANEQGGVVLPAGYEMEAFEGKRGQMLDLLPYLEYHNSQLLRSALAQFLSLGQEGRGSYALSADHSRLFLLACNATADWIAQTVTRHAIRQLVRLNWPDLEHWPRLRHAPIDHRDPTSLAQALTALVSGRLLTPDAALEADLRRLFNLPQGDA